jgi:hypothetical protein
MFDRGNGFKYIIPPSLRMKITYVRSCASAAWYYRRKNILTS